MKTQPDDPRHEPPPALAPPQDSSGSCQQQAWRILEQSACATGGCACQDSLARFRGPGHCPACADQPNLSLRVACDRLSGALRLWCKAGCSREQLARFFAEIQPVAVAEKKSVTRLPRQRTCLGCHVRLLGRRRQTITCSDRCRQRLHRHLARQQAGLIP